MKAWWMAGLLGASLWRQVGWDMGLKPSDYAEFGFTVNQCDRNMPVKY